MDRPGVDDGHVREEEDFPMPDLGAASCRVLSCHVIININTLHADALILYYRRLFPFHCSDTDSRQHDNSVVFFPHQGQQPCIAVTVIDITLSLHTEVHGDELPVQPCSLYCIRPVGLQQRELATCKSRAGAH